MGVLAEINISVDFDKDADIKKGVEFIKNINEELKKETGEDTNVGQFNEYEGGIDFEINSDRVQNAEWQLGEVKALLVKKVKGITEFNASVWTHSYGEIYEGDEFYEEAGK